MPEAEKKEREKGKEAKEVKEVKEVKEELKETKGESKPVLQPLTRGQLEALRRKLQKKYH